MFERERRGEGHCMRERTGQKTYANTCTHTYTLFERENGTDGQREREREGQRGKKRGREGEG